MQQPQQRGARQLAGLVAGQGLDEVHALVDLEAGDAGAGEGDDVLWIGAGPRLRRDDGFHRLAPLVVGHADDGDFRDRGMAEDGALDFRRIDILRAGDDHRHRVLHGCARPGGHLIPVRIFRQVSQRPLLLQLQNVL